MAASKSALDAGQLDRAQEAFSAALSAAYRGGADSDMSVKCLGRDTAQRWHQLKLDLKRAVTGSRGSTDLYLVAADDGAAGLVKSVSGKRGPQVRGMVHEIQEISRRLRGEQDYGAYLLSGEQGIIAACDKALPEIKKQARRVVEKALEMEAEAFYRPVSDQERDMVANANDMASALTGVTTPATDDAEVIYLNRRIDDSMEQLAKARDWDLESTDDLQDTAWGMRARERGDVVSEKASNISLTFRGRDKLYARASRYYDFGGWVEQREGVDSQREGIQGELEAESAGREAEMEAAATEMQRKADALKASVQEMTKSEKEQESFKKEADAMEAELGF
jgi:hypothetical protein